MNKFLLLFITFCMFSGVLTKAAAQGNLQNISSVNVDNVSDQQIGQLLQQASKSGLSDSEIIQQAQAKGMSQGQAQKLQERISAYRQSNTQQNSTTGNDTTGFSQRKLNYQPDSADNSNGRTNVLDNLKPKIFGADIFKNKNSTFQPNLKLATPVNYILGPGDQLIINVYGRSLVNWKLDVSPEGNVNIPGVGVLNVGGKTIETATAAIKAKLAANNYAVDR